MLGRSPLSLTTLTLTDCTVSYNTAKYGGGLFNYLGTATVTNCTISGNTAGSRGGGLYDDSGVLTLTNSIVSDNSATGGYGNGGGLEIYHSAARAVLTDCTISGNSASQAGGGLTSTGSETTLTECTISSNSANGAGGLLVQSPGAMLTNCTVSGNSASQAGGGLVYAGPITLNNTIVAGNSTLPDGGGSASDIFGGPTIVGGLTGSYNLIGTGGSGALSNGVNGNQVGVASPLLGNLGDYGGPTPTIPLLPGSPAIGTGSKNLAVDPSTGRPLVADQRGYTPSNMADIGAYQDQGFTLTPVTGSTPQSALAGTAFANPLAVTVTANNAGAVHRPGRRRRGRLCRADVGGHGRPLGRHGDHRRRPGQRHGHGRRDARPLHRLRVRRRLPRHAPAPGQPTANHHLAGRAVARDGRRRLQPADLGHGRGGRALHLRHHRGGPPDRLHPLPTGPAQRHQHAGPDLQLHRPGHRLCRLHRQRGLFPGRRPGGGHQSGHRQPADDGDGRRGLLSPRRSSTRRTRTATSRRATAARRCRWRWPAAPDRCWGPPR